MNKPPDKMLTVGEINSTFAEKGVQVQLPLPASSWSAASRYWSARRYQAVWPCC